MVILTSDALFSALDLGQNDFSTFRPTERLCPVSIMSVNKLSNRLTQFLHTAKGAAIQRSALELREPALDGVQPRGAGGGEVQLDAWVLGKPRFHFNGLVCGAIIQDDMQVQRRIRGLVDLTHELEEFASPVARC